MKYEYNTVNNPTFLGDRLLNKLGDEGWELITHAYNSNTCDHFYTFKREKVSNQDPAYSSREITIEDIHKIHKEISDKETELEEGVEMYKIGETEEEKAYRKGYMDGYDEGLYDGENK